MNLRKKAKESLSGWLFASPAAAILALFIYIPLIVAVWVSLNRWNVLRPMRYIGISNYISMFKDADFWRSLYITILYVLGTVPASIIIALLLAMLLNQKWLKGLSIYRTLFYIPVITAMAAAAVVWSWLFEPNAGLINYILRLIGVSPKGWLTDTHWALVALIIVGIWKRIGKCYDSRWPSK